MINIEQTKMLFETGMASFKEAEPDLKNVETFSPEQRNNVREALTESFRELFAYMSGCLTEDDLLIAVTSAMKWKTAAIADFMFMSESSIRVRRHRMKAKLPKEIHEFFFRQASGVSFLKILILHDGFSNACKRFPVATAFLFAFTILSLYLVWSENTFMSAAQQGISLCCCASAVLLNILLKIHAEESAVKGISRLSVVSNLILIGYDAYQFLRPEMLSTAQWVLPQLGIAVALTAAFFCIGFKAEKNDVPLWNHAWLSLLGIAVCIVTGGVLTLGLLLLDYSVENLFTLKIADEWDNSLLLVGMCIIPAFLFLSHIPATKERHNATAYISNAVSFITRNVLVPLVVIYLFILYLYAARILLRWELPDGGVAVLVCTLMSVSLLIELLLYPSVVSGKADRVEVFMVHWLPLLVLPLLVLMSTGIFRRISDYGLTINRLYLMTLSAWFYYVCIRLFFQKRLCFKWIITSFAAVLFVVSVFPVNFHSITTAYRHSRLNELISGNIPEVTPMDKTAYDKWIASFSPQDAKAVNEEIKYLNRICPAELDDFVSGGAVQDARTESYYHRKDYPVSLPDGSWSFYGEAIAEDFCQQAYNSLSLTVHGINDSVSCTFILDSVKLKEVSDGLPTPIISADSSFFFIPTQIHYHTSGETAVIYSERGWLYGKR